MLRLSITWLVPLAVISSGFGLNVKSAIAQEATAELRKQTNDNVYEFSIPYTVFTDIDTTFRPDLNISRVSDRGESSDALYGLTNFLSNAYAQAEFRGTTIFSSFNANPAVFGIEGEILGDRFFGGSNELFTRSSGSFETDLVNGVIRGSGNLVVLGGTGLFENATGTVTFTQENNIDPANPTATAVGTATLNFSLRTSRKIPEPNATIMLISLGLTGTYLRLRRKTTSVS
ncbi:hypothetical protein AB0758_48885 [Tolypothrix bouteillei VB521301_2]|uniref:PEP-CTERM protein-sorting domain-containing protein n=1 Tax=Tolypothrix bouteillei VB521301 TaxID=1479485 RepID=A0A0C1NG17_9CYAN